MTMWFSSGSQLVLFFGSLVIVVVMAIFVTRMVAGQRLRYAGKNIKIIESIGLAPASSLCLVQVGDKYLLVGVTKENIHLIAHLEAEDLTLDQETGQPVAFSKYLERFLTKKEREGNEHEDN